MPAPPLVAAWSTSAVFDQGTMAVPDRPLQLGGNRGQQMFRRKSGREPDKYRGARRRFLFTLAVMLPAVTVGGLAGALTWRGSRRMGPTSDVDALVLARLDWARRLADGPVDALLASSTTFLMVLDRCGSDEVLWRGFGRLGELALASDSADRRALASRLLASCGARAMPVGIRHLCDRVRVQGEQGP